jgi:hypothetical protein
LRTLLKQSHPDESSWAWDTTNTWYTQRSGDPFDPDAPAYNQWALNLYAPAGELDWGYIAIVPFWDGKPLPLGDKPEPWHREWVVMTVGAPENACTIRFGGLLAETKRWVDALLASDTPPLPPL